MPEYALRMSDEERRRYRFMAEHARTAEQEQAVEAARQEADLVGVSNVTISEGDATDTGIEPGSVDVVMIRHVLAHNGGREDAIVAHAATLLRPGGSVYLVDIEGKGLALRPLDPDVEDLQARYAQWHAKQGNDLSVGLRLADLLTAAGLEVTTFVGYYNIVEMPRGMRPPGWAARNAMVASGVATPEDVARWGAAVDRMDTAEPRHTLFAPIFLSTGRRPK